MNKTNTKKCKTLSCAHKEVPVEELIDIQITLCNYSILDFYLIEKIVELLNANEEGIDFFIQKIILQLKAKNSVRKFHEKEEQVIQIQKLITFLYTVILNLESATPLLLILESNIFSLLMSLLKTAKNKPLTDNLAKIIVSVFMDEFNNKFTSYTNSKLVMLYTKYYEQFIFKYNCPFEKLSEKSSEAFFEEFTKLSMKLFQATIQTQNFLSESQVSQSIIEILFSLEIPEVNGGNALFMYQFYYNIIKNNMDNTKASFGDKYTTLFRKDELSTEVIKHLFICLGNYCYVKSFVNPFKVFLINNKKSHNGEVMVDKKFFIAFFFEMLSNLKTSLSAYLISILKLIYKNTNDVFDIDKGNYAPLITALIFNYFVSPKIQEIYGISPKEIPILSQFNRLIRNICYKTMFNEKDELFTYNDLIVYCHEQLDIFIQKHVLSVNEEKELQNTRKYSKFLLPKFLLTLNSHILIEAFKMKVKVSEEEYTVVSNKNDINKFILINAYFFDEQYIQVNYK